MSGEQPAAPASAERQMWTAWVRERAVRALPPEKLLPDRQPSYVSSWIYVFGVATIASFAVIVASGVILGLKGPEWWHVTGIGRFFNSIHLWSVELFFFAMVVHLWGKFFLGAWRGGRGRTWVTGAITFLVAIGAFRTVRAVVACLACSTELLCAWAPPLETASAARALRKATSAVTSSGIGRVTTRVLSMSAFLSVGGSSRRRVGAAREPRRRRGRLPRPPS